MRYREEESSIEVLKVHYNTADVIDSEKVSCVSDFFHLLLAVLDFTGSRKISYLCSFLSQRFLFSMLRLSRNIAHSG